MRPATSLRIVAVALVVFAAVFAIVTISRSPDDGPTGIAQSGRQDLAPEDPQGPKGETKPLPPNAVSDPARPIAAKSAADWHKFDDPSQDGWSSEAFSEAAAKQLKQIILFLRISLLPHRKKRVYNQILNPWNNMVLKPKIQVRKLFPKILFNCLITQGVPRLVEPIPITMHLQTVIGQMDEVVIAFEGILI